MSLNSIWRYDDFLPAVADQHRVKLGEGQTPLLKSRTLGPLLGVKDLYFKLENMNPTGSYKDRFAAAFVSILRSKGQEICVATSSGNTGAALAAYCAASGIKCFVAIVDGAPLGKIKQMQIYGAHAYMVQGFGTDTEVTSRVFSLLEEITHSVGLPLPISAYRYCSEGMQGVQTIAYEILDDMQDEDVHIFSPAGGGGLTLSIAKGATEYARKYPNTFLPVVHCVQPEGNNTIAGALRNNKKNARKIDFSRTEISGLQVPNILDGDQTISACRSLGGNGYIVSDRETFQWQRLLGTKEGIFCEPAGAVALAGLAKAVEEKRINSTDKVVCLITGSGFKDMQTVDKYFALPQPEYINSELLYQHIKKLSQG
ncbi:MAG: pyridoxal-phosphate dependent enzyme [Chitinophagaceae bacterium]|nr:pyridoxal-phosphate dependent enzyme [Chitinophagaceae bacterium]